MGKLLSFQVDEMELVDEGARIELHAAMKNAVAFMLMPSRTHWASSEETSASKSATTGTGGTAKTGPVVASTPVAGSSVDSEFVAAAEHTLPDKDEHSTTAWRSRKVPPGRDISERKGDATRAPQSADAPGGNEESASGLIATAAGAGGRAVASAQDAKPVCAERGAAANLGETAAAFTSEGLGGADVRELEAPRFMLRSLPDRA